jgi:hypothetical protein
MTAPEGASRAGVLGMPFFSEAAVSLAFGATAVTVTDPAAPPPPGLSWEPLIVRDAPWIRAGIAGRAREWFRLDTGKSGTVSVMSAAAMRWALPESSGKESENATVEGGTVELPLSLSDFEIGGRRIGELAAARKLPGTPNDDVDGTGGWIGRGAFEGTTLTIDCRNRRYAARRTEMVAPANRAIEHLGNRAVFTSASPLPPSIPASGAPRERSKGRA